MVKGSGVDVCLRREDRTSASEPNRDATSSPSFSFGEAYIIALRRHLQTFQHQAHVCLTEA